MKGIWYVKKPIYFVIGMAFLIILAITFTVFDESTEIQNEDKEEPEIMITGTPADKYSPDERGCLHRSESTIHPSRY